MNYRIDIQILRGVSVLLVVLFHFGFSAAQSGFLGVDVFFVISGFLMAVLYKQSDILGFFTRRAKRLLPPYFVVIAATLCASFLFVTRNESAQVVTQAWFGTFYLSNIGFWMQNSYFSKAEFNPLLHLWSLGVEIQFYLCIPILVWFFNKWKLLLPLFLALSLALCLVMLGISGKTSFFMMPLRTWEFLLGFGTALYLCKNGNTLSDRRQLWGLLGLVFLCCIPALPVNGESDSLVFGHPGLSAVLVCLATALVLAFGLPAKLMTSLPGVVLETLGKYSYSIYLVHFPVIVIYLSEPFSGTNLTFDSTTDLAVVFALVTVLSIALHQLVERRSFKTNIWSLTAGATVVVAALATLLPLVHNQFMPDRERKLFAAFTDRTPYRCGKLFRVVNPKAQSCTIMAPAADPDALVLLVGNSHADSLKTAFAESALEHNIRVDLVVHNDPMMAGGMTSQSIVREAKRIGATHIAVHFSPDRPGPEKIIELAELANASDLPVFFIDPVPVWESHIPKSLYWHYKAEEGLPGQSVEQYRAFNAGLFEALEGISHNGFQRFSPADILCTPECAFTDDDNVPLYFDRGHLTLTGSRALAPMFDTLFDALRQPEAAENQSANAALTQSSM